MKNITDKSKLVKKFMEHRDWDEYRIALGTKARGRGIYALYRGDRLYYIGRSKTSLRGRLRQHARRDKHKGKWDNWSFYQIGRTKYIKDIESLILRINRPEGNRVKGKFKRKYDLGRKLYRGK